jgi:tetratricopeptide (TPR) repeat protein
MGPTSELLAQAITHHQAGRLQEAKAICRQVIAGEPRAFDAWHMLGVLEYQQGRMEAAANDFFQATQLNPTVAEAQINLGHALRAQGSVGEAAQCFRRAVELEPQRADAHCNLGNALNALGNWNDAIAHYQQALTIRPDFTEAHMNLGTALQAKGQLDEAAASYRRAIEISPEFAEAHNNLGSVLQEKEQFDEAIACHRRAVELNPQFDRALANLGRALRMQGKLAEAAECCTRALQLNPRNIDAHNNLGIILVDVGDLEQAVACHRRALELKPDDADSWLNLGVAMKQQGNFQAAADCYARALELNPDSADAHTNQATLRLLQGDYERGLPEYDWRWKTGQLPLRKFDQPAWRGEPLRGQTILLCAEQGIGDTIQFIRYAPILQKSGATVIVDVPKPLVPLFSRCPGIERLVGEGDNLPGFDVHAPLMSLPALLRTTLGTIPADVPYLFAAPALVEHWRDKLSAVPGFRIGINWHGREGIGPFRRRDIPLELFSRIGAVPGVRLINLQQGHGRNELAEAGDKLPIIDFGDQVDAIHGAFMDTAVIITNLDLVLTSDTAIAHLAGALGVPVWLALPFVPDWRWMLDRSDSPWYPTMRLFRQRQPGDWADVFEEIRQALGDDVEQRSKAQAR